MKGGKIWSTVVDYFLILSAIIGVGFASGKEIYVFFFQFKNMSLIGVIAFSLVFIYLFFIIDYIKYKLNIGSYNQFNAIIFKKLCGLTNVILIINFIITSAGMLAGADYLFITFFNVGFRLPSIVLCLLAYIIVTGGIDRVKWISNLIIPILISVIVINSLTNITPQNVNLGITTKSCVLALVYGLLFGINNFVAGLPVMFESKLKAKGKLFVTLTVALIIILNILVLASNTFVSDMPMFELSKNVSMSFYYIYFITLILALFCTLLICNYNVNKIICKDKKSKFVPLITILSCFALSNLGYNFIVKYLYVVSGIFSSIYILSLIILIFIKLIKLKKQQKNK